MCIRDRDGGSRRNVHEIAGGITLGKPANPPSVDQVGLVTIESVTIVCTKKAEIREQLRAFNKERSLFREKGFECAKVNDGRIDFNLAKIRIDGCIEKNVRTQRVLEVESRGGVITRSIIEWIPRQRRLDEIAPADNVGHDLERAMRPDSIDTRQLRHSRRQATLLSRYEFIPVPLVLSIDGALHVESPYLT